MLDARDRQELERDKKNVDKGATEATFEPKRAGGMGPELSGLNRPKAAELQVVPSRVGEELESIRQLLVKTL